MNYGVRPRYSVCFKTPIQREPWSVSIETKIKVIIVHGKCYTIKVSTEMYKDLPRGVDTSRILFSLDGQIPVQGLYLVWHIC